MRNFYSTSNQWDLPPSCKMPKCDLFYVRSSRFEDPTEGWRFGPSYRDSRRGLRCMGLNIVEVLRRQAKLKNQPDSVRGPIREVANRCGAVDLSRISHSEAMELKVINEIATKTVLKLRPDAQVHGF